MNNPKYKVREFNCLSCGVLVSKRCPSSSKYCSIDCYRNGSRPSRRIGETKPCANCGKEIYVRPCDAKGMNFCSVDCHNSHQSRNKLRYKCAICEGEFLWSPSRIKQHEPKYCSIACRNKCATWKQKAVIGGNLKLQTMKGPTSLEKLGYAILDDLAVKYERQVLIAGKFVVDAFLADVNIVVQWDGDYWHGFRAANDNAPLQPRQAKRARLDKSQDAYMEACGYVVLRFWEHEVKKTPDDVKARIQFEHDEVTKAAEVANAPTPQLDLFADMGVV